VRRKRELERSGSREVSRDRAGKRLSALSLSEADAMKPVDEVEALGEGPPEQPHHNLQN
jgi:hypothetical protein